MDQPWSSPEAEWVRAGSALFASALASLSDSDLPDPSLLPDWSRAFVVSHVAANAQAIGRLLHWARTGEPTPMYESFEARDQEIRDGAALPASELREWFVSSDAAVNHDFDTLDASAWSHEVVTAQGRTVPARETLWMRSREVCIHAVDLAASVTFDELPEGFLQRLVTEVVAKHSANDDPRPTIRLHSSDTSGEWVIDGGPETVDVQGSLARIAQWVSGRGADGISVTGEGGPPQLPKWL